MSFGYNEDLLQFIWEYQLYNAASLITADGTAIQIIKQGYLNRSNGPDFERAEIRIANTTHHGSVEIHVDSRECEQHGHLSLSEYWNTHYTFDKSSDKKRKSISSGFVNHLFLNAIVPFIFFYEKEKMETATDKAINYLYHIPSEKNSIISKWKSSGIESNNALTSQALLHLYKTYCTPQRCLECSIGKKLLLN